MASISRIVTSVPRVRAEVATSAPMKPAPMTMMRRPGPRCAAIRSACRCRTRSLLGPGSLWGRPPRGQQHGVAVHHRAAAQLDRLFTGQDPGGVRAQPDLHRLLGVPVTGSIVLIGEEPTSPLRAAALIAETPVKPRPHDDDRAGHGWRVTTIWPLSTSTG